MLWCGTGSGLGGHQVQVSCQALWGMELPANSVCLPSTALSASGRGLWGGKASSSGSPGGWWTQLWSLIHSVLILGASCPPAPGQSHCCTLGGGCPHLRLPDEEEDKGGKGCRLQRVWHKWTPTCQGAAAAAEWPREQPGQCRSGQEPATGHWDCLQDTLIHLN